MLKFQGISKTELDSDRDTRFINMNVSSSSEDAETEDGEDADFQSFEAYDGQTDNQLVVLEDIKALFSENQELPDNSV